jgi:hypothetical protein
MKYTGTGVRITLASMAMKTAVGARAAARERGVLEAEGEVGGVAGLWAAGCLQARL